ncbi:unnamed protein product [Rotaria sp. Silwood1]|nr:unnamed protein product [Rotaria sp. Silwood1]
MVAIIRAATARQQQSFNADTIVVPVTSITAVPSTSVIFTSPSFNPSSSNTCLVNIPTTASTYLSTVKLTHQCNNDVVAINDAIDINDANQCINLLSTKFNQINNNQEDKSCNLDDDKELGTIVT